MDAQVFWDHLGSSSCWHGVTSVVMGNCGFTLAPSRPGEHKLVTDNLERAEDIPAASMAEGIDWTWESFPEYLDAVEAQPKAINYASQIGHSALRTFAMGERAFTEQATDEDLAVMEQTLREALRAGAFGFTTSMSDSPPDPRRQTRRLAPRHAGRRSAASSRSSARRAAASSSSRSTPRSPRTTTPRWRRSSTTGSATSPSRPGSRSPTALAPTTSSSARHLRRHRRGGREDVRPVARATYLDRVYCFKTKMPFDDARGMEGLPRPAPRRAARDSSAIRRCGRPREGGERRLRGASLARARASRTRTSPTSRPSRASREGLPDVSVAALAAERKVEPVELILDLCLETKLEQTFTRFTTPQEDAELLATMRHPRTIMTFSDSGAHVSYRSGPTCRRPCCRVGPRAGGLHPRGGGPDDHPLPGAHLAARRRGLLREEMIADINVFDPETIAPGVPVLVNDLPRRPAGAPARYGSTTRSSPERDLSRWRAHGRLPRAAPTHRAAAEHCPESRSRKPTACRP